MPSPPTWNTGSACAQASDEVADRCALTARAEARKASFESAIHFSRPGVSWLVPDVATQTWASSVGRRRVMSARPPAWRWTHSGLASTTVSRVSQSTVGTPGWK